MVVFERVIFVRGGAAKKWYHGKSCINVGMPNQGNYVWNPQAYWYGAIFNRSQTAAWKSNCVYGQIKELSQKYMDMATLKSLLDKKWSTQEAAWSHINSSFAYSLTAKKQGQNLVDSLRPKISHINQNFRFSIAEKEPVQSVNISAKT